MSNFLLINKPSGPTSHDIIDKLRQITGIQKIGHAGTLDPFAKGLLLVAVGRESTRQISKFVKLDKEYVATLKLGVVSNTYDQTGEIEFVTQALRPDKKDVEKILSQFIGVQEQIPPMYSAKKINGKKLYELARQGVEVEREPQEVEVYKIKVLSFQNSSVFETEQDGSRYEPGANILVLKIHCSSGTYIRTLAHDIGQVLGCGAYLQELVRTKIGKYKLEDAIKLDKLNKNNWQEHCLQKL